MTIWVKKANLFFKIIALLFLLIAIYTGYAIFFPCQLPNKEYRLIIAKDENIAHMALQLKAAHIIHNKRAFLLLLRVLHKDRKVTAGLYILKRSLSSWGLVNRITNGKPDKISITFVDGETLAQIRAEVNQLQNIKHLSITMSDSQLRAVLKITYPSLEGVFYPETYFLAPNQTDLEIYYQSYKLMQERLNVVYLKRSKNTIYTKPYQLLVMASLIERETNHKADMPLIAAVFNNRLRLNMRLQDDPAVFYGLTTAAIKLKHNKISRTDFQIDTPYNTYLHDGLPPTPICTPSLAALMAAAQPINNPKLLYFLSIGDGKTRFSQTYGEHLSAIKKQRQERHQLRHKQQQQTASTALAAQPLPTTVVEQQANINIRSK